MELPAHKSLEFHSRVGGKSYDRISPFLNYILLSVNVSRGPVWRRACGLRKSCYNLHSFCIHGDGGVGGAGSLD